MTRLEDLQPNAAVRGILPDALATVVVLERDDEFLRVGTELHFGQLQGQEMPQGKPRSAMPGRQML